MHKKIRIRPEPKEGTFLGIPYDWRWPTPAVIKERSWNRKDPRIFTPKIFGWGWAINFYQVFQLIGRHKFIFSLIAVVSTVLFAWFIYWNIVVPWPYHHELKACLETAQALSDQQQVDTARNTCFRTHPHFN